MKNEKLIANAIRDGLHKKKMSQTDLAKLLDIKPNTVNHWCSGLNFPPGDKLVKIINLLNIKDLLFPNKEYEYDLEFSKENLVNLINRINLLEKKINVFQEEKNELRKKISKRIKRKKPTVLIIDDKIYIYKFLVERLTEIGYVVDVSTNIRDALKLYSEKEHNFIILDYIIPGESSIKFVPIINKKRTGIIIFTGYSIDDAKREFLDIGFDAIIEKGKIDWIDNVVNSIEKIIKERMYKELFQED